eukprot:gene9878-11592_t
MLMSPIVEATSHTQYIENTVKTVLHNAGIAPVQLDGKDISSYFGVRAAAKQKAMGTGRHPASLPKNSELWHYSKLSTQRRDRIKKGHQFWDVVEEENVTSTIPQADTEVKEEEDEYTIRARELSFLKGSSINQKLRKFLSSTKNNDMQHLELRIDFKNKNQIYFGMSFIIMNYNDEILYVNSREELRCKPISQIESSDRIKFKMVDLNNPSNPQALSFGDTMYLQCLDSSETADNSFSVGTVLTSKLFGLPQHSSLNFDVNQHFTTTDNYGPASTSIPTDIGVYADETADATPEIPVSDKLPPATPNLIRRGSAMNIVRTAPTTPHSSHTHPHTPGLKPLEIDEYTNASAFDFPSPDKNAGDASFKDSNNVDSASGAVSPVNKVAPSHTTRHFTNAATICGDCHITRICEMRQLENSLGVSADFNLLSDDKAMRYTSKAAALLGKWCVHSAELPNSPTKPKDKQRGRHDNAKKEGMHSMHATKSDTHNSGTGPLKDHRVYSMTPIFIQQDLYCISTKQPSEHTTWPMRSTAIINHSQNISRDTALEYRQAYRESAVVKNALQARQHTKGTTRLYDPDDLLETDHASLTSPNGKNNSDNASTGGLNSPTPLGGANSNSNTPTNGNNNKTEPSYGCLRKVVRRGPPYDFSVDRRCVWKFCLFEQFSDNNIKLSVKDRAAKKVMETATMAMKLSQLNREGAHTHIHSHVYGHELPPLKSGESFVRTLREINFKTTMKLEEKYLQMRREKEARLSEHFAMHMTQFRQMERQDTRNTASSQGSRSNSTARTASPHSPVHGNYNASFGAGHSKLASDGSLAESSMDTFSQYSSVSSKMPNLMSKNATRRTSFLIDTLPTSVKNKKSSESFSSPQHGGGSVSSAYSGSVFSSKNADQNNSLFSPSTASARISAFGNPPPAVKFTSDTAENSPMHSPTKHSNVYGNANLGNGGSSTKHHTTHYHAPISALNNNNTSSTSSSHIHNGIVKDVVSSTFLTAAAPSLTINTTLPHSNSSLASTTGTNRTKQNVTFSTPTPTSQYSNPTPTRYQQHKNTVTSPHYDSYPDTPGKNNLVPSAQFSEIQHAMKLVTQAVAALPDMDQKALKREEEIHLNPR